jgi:hypothetical protein
MGRKLIKKSKKTTKKSKKDTKKKVINKMKNGNIITIK